MKNKILLCALLLFPIASLSLIPARVGSGTPTPPPDVQPTVDIFAEPQLPEDPTQLDLGAHIYWHHCMPCHGDAGQGLTDEFRLQWEPDHQNCWDPGCHSGRYEYDSFPVPTIVPPLVNVGLTARYNPASLFTFLRSTHPPQDPGLLEDEEYEALVAYLYQMNNAALPEPNPSITPVPTITRSSSTSSSDPPAAVREGSMPVPASILLLLGFLLLVLLSGALIYVKKP